MTLNDLLDGKGYDLRQVVVLRHRPHEPELNKVLPFLVVNRMDLFDAFQQTQSKRVEKALQQAGYVASFIRFGGKRAVFVGLYKKTGEKPMTHKQFWASSGLSNCMTSMG